MPQWIEEFLSSLCCGCQAHFGIPKNDERPDSPCLKINREALRFLNDLKVSRVISSTDAR